MEIKVMDKVLAANDAWAKENRDLLKDKGILMLNLIGSPGAGKTTLLEKTIEILGPEAIGVIEGDIATTKDAQRIHDKNVPVFQINTGTACHLDAHLVNSAIKDLCRQSDALKIIFVENIGNLVCPAEFDIGEQAKIAVLSVTEGDDKVEKYPLLFSEAKAMVISKIGLLPHTNCSLETVTAEFKKLNPEGEIFQVDSLSGQGMEEWVEFLNNI